MVETLVVQQAVHTGLLSGLIKQFVQYGYEVECHSKWTMRTRETHLKQFMIYCESQKLSDITFITLPFVDQYFVEYTKNHSKSTTNTGRRVLKVFFAWVRAYKEIDLRLDERRIKLVRIVDTTPKAIDRSVIEYVIRHTTGHQDKLMIALAFEGALRISELVNIRVGDIIGSTVRVLGKNSVERYVPISSCLATRLRLYVRDRGNTTTDYLFQNVYRNTTTEQMATCTARLRIQKWFMELVGIKMYPHQLRHSFAIEMLKAGCDVPTISRILGHSDIKITMNYLRVSDGLLASQRNQYFGSSVL